MPVKIFITPQGKREFNHKTDLCVLRTLYHTVMRLSLDLCPVSFKKKNYELTYWSAGHCGFHL